MLALLDTCHATTASRGRLCACLEPSALGRLRAVAADAHLAAGDTVYQAGEPASSIFGLRQGSIMLSARMADGRRQVLSFLYPGDLFGFAAGPVQAFTASALERSAICRIPLAALEADADLAARLHVAANACLAEACDQVLRLGRMGAGERVADFLYRLWRRQGQPGEVHLPMRLADIGDHLGLRPETVSRHVAALRRAGALGHLGLDGVLPVLDPETLRPR